MRIILAILAFILFLSLFSCLLFDNKWSSIILLTPLWYYLFLLIFNLHQEFIKYSFDKDGFYFILIGIKHYFKWSDIKAIQIIYNEGEKQEIYGVTLYTYDNKSYFIRHYYFINSLIKYLWVHKLDSTVINEIVNGYTILKHLTIVSFFSFYGLSWYFEGQKNGDFFTENQDLYLLMLFMTTLVSIYFLVQVFVVFFKLINYYVFLNRKKAEITISRIVVDKLVVRKM